MSHPQQNSGSTPPTADAGRTILPPAVWRSRVARHLTAEHRWSDSDIRAQLALFTGWDLLPAGAVQALPVIRRRCLFSDFNALEPVLIRLLAIARLQDHHPDVQFGYREMTVHWSTHSAGGISDNDWICAALLEEVLDTVNR